MSQEDPAEQLHILRRQRMDAIKKCEFKQARFIDQQMTLIKQNMAKTNIDDRRRSAEALYETEKEAIRLAAANKYSEATTLIYQAKTAFQKHIQQIEQAQKEALESLEEENAKDLELSQIRVIPDALVLKNKAQTSAVIRDYDAADMYFQESQDTERDTRTVLREEVNDSYRIKREKLLEQFEKDRKTCREAYRHKIEEILRKHRLAGTRLDLRLGMRAHTLKLPLRERFDVDEPELDVDEIDEQVEWRAQSTGSARGPSTNSMRGPSSSSMRASTPSSPQKTLSGSFSPRAERTIGRFLPE